MSDFENPFKSNTPTPTPSPAPDELHARPPRTQREYHLLSDEGTRGDFDPDNPLNIVGRSRRRMRRSKWMDGKS